MTYVTTHDWLSSGHMTLYKSINSSWLFWDYGFFFFSIERK